MVKVQIYQDFYDAEKFMATLSAVVFHYERSAPIVARWAEDLYQKVQESPEKVTMRDMVVVLTIVTGDTLTPPAAAANYVYKHLAASGYDTTGLADF